MKILIAPDAFKGAASGAAVASALAEGVLEIWPHAEIVERPLSDGGEGLLCAVSAGARGVERTTATTGPHGEPLQAAYWRSEDGETAVIEMARAAGLSVTRHRDPIKATTAGVAALMRAAIADGAQRIELGAGGSATVDGGAGILAALGFRLLDASGAPIPFGGGGLERLASIEAPEDPLGGVELRLLSDVTNPLLGPEGAAAVYGPQKGADPAMVERLERGLCRFAEVLTATFGRDPRTLEGAGAAGGLVGGLWAALDAAVAPGFDVVAGLVDLEGALEGAERVLTGEGRVDEQTPYGKTIGRLLDAAGDRPAWVFAGQVTPEAEAAFGARAALIPIMDGPRTLESAMAQTRPLLRRAAARAARLSALR